MLPPPRIQSLIRRSRSPPPDAEQRPEGVEWVEAPVEPESELVEVSLKVLRADSVVTAPQASHALVDRALNSDELSFCSQNLSQ
jgi:hypothetical protein